MYIFPKIFPSFPLSHGSRLHEGRIHTHTFKYLHMCCFAPDLVHLSHAVFISLHNLWLRISLEAFLLIKTWKLKNFILRNWTIKRPLKSVDCENAIKFNQRNRVENVQVLLYLFDEYLHFARSFNYFCFHVQCCRALKTSLTNIKAQKHILTLNEEKSLREDIIQIWVISQISIHKSRS